MDGIQYSIPNKNIVKVIPAMGKEFNLGIKGKRYYANLELIDIYGCDYVLSLEDRLHSIRALNVFAPLPLLQERFNIAPQK